MLNKRAFEFSFGWIFAIIVGAAVLSLAIYAAVKIVDTQRDISQASAGKEFGILLSPIETGLEGAKKSSPIIFPVKTRVFNNCDYSGAFGNQKISTSIESGIGNQWKKPGVESSFQNKYMFSASTIEGKNMYVFSKPLLLPYKIADLLYIYSSDEKFCFVNAPEYIEDEITGLDLRGINITQDKTKCPKGSKKVCFTGTGCEIEVDLTSQSVRKNKQTVYFVEDENDALIYAAIFADVGIYECQIKRLMKRNSEIASILAEKSMIVGSVGCSSNLESELITFSNMTLSLNNSLNLRTILPASDELARRNNLLVCNLF